MRNIDSTPLNLGHIVCDLKRYSQHTLQLNNCKYWSIICRCIEF